MAHPTVKLVMTMLDKRSSSVVRLQAEAELREYALIGLLHNAQNRDTVLETCRRVREALGGEIGPQPVRFTERELHYVIGLLGTVEMDGSGESVAILSKLRHKEKLMRNLRNREKIRSGGLQELS